MSPNENINNENSTHHFTANPSVHLTNIRGPTSSRKHNLASHLYYHGHPRPNQGTRGAAIMEESLKRFCREFKVKGDVPDDILALLGKKAIGKEGAEDTNDAEKAEEIHANKITADDLGKANLEEAVRDK